MMKLRKAFDNIWEVKKLGHLFKEKDKELYYEVFLDGFSCSLIDLEEKKDD